MQYVSYREKSNIKELFDIQYEWNFDIEFIAALNFIISKSWPEAAISMIVDALNWDLQQDNIINIFHHSCIVENNPLAILNRDSVTVSDLFSN